MAHVASKSSLHTSRAVAVAVVAATERLASSLGACPVTRPSFTTSIAVPWVHNEDSTVIKGSLADGRYAAETVTGVSRRRPQGWVPPTPYTFIRERRDRALGSHSVVTVDTSTGKTVQNRKVTGAVDNPTTGITPAPTQFNEAYVLPASPPSSFTDRALVKARLAMKDSDVNLGVAFAERSATARMVGDNATTIAKAFMALKRGRTEEALRRLKLLDRGGARTGKTTIERWLEMQYGWKPLLSDVYGACDALEKAPRSDWMVTGKGSYSEKVYGKVNRPGSLGYECTMEGMMGSFVRIDAQPENELLHTLAALGITNPAEIAWELVPYSFVVDWFLPIGSWLSSLDAMLGYGPTWCSISKITRGKWKSVGNPSLVRTSSPYVETTTNAWGAWKETVSLSRTVSTSVPLPTLPRFKDPRSLAHMANGLSLLAQAFSRS